jgi:hypothetical protein
VGDDTMYDDARTQARLFGRGEVVGDDTMHDDARTQARLLGRGEVVGDDTMHDDARTGLKAGQPPEPPPKLSPRWPLSLSPADLMFGV